MNGNQNGVEPHKRFANIVRNEIEIENVDEFQNERKANKELEKMAKSGNRFAEAQQVADESNLKANFEAFMKKPCKHIIKTAFGGKIALALSITAQQEDGWVFQEKTCMLCGKTLEERIYKPKKPERGF